MRPFILTFIVLFALTVSCEKQITTHEREIHIYLLSDYESHDSSMRIYESTVKPEDVPLINYSDILSYDSRIHAFKISSSAQDTLKSEGLILHTKAFALVANQEIIYTGYFWSSFSSAMCDWLTIDPLHAEVSGELRVQLGYPGLMDDWNIPDCRNDYRILSILRKDHKLID